MRGKSRTYHRIRQQNCTPQSACWVPVTGDSRTSVREHETVDAKLTTLWSLGAWKIRAISNGSYKLTQNRRQQVSYTEQSNGRGRTWSHLQGLESKIYGTCFGSKLTERNRTKKVTFTCPYTADRRKGK